MGFVIHWHESAMELHVFPIPIPPPTSLATWSLWVFPVHQAQALVSCIPPGLVICFTIDNIHAVLSKHPTFALEKTLESPLDSKVIQPVHPKGNQSWMFIERTDAEAETPVLWPSDVKTDSFENTLMLGKIEGGRRRGWQRIKWLDGLTDTMDMSVSKLWELVDREAWRAAVHSIAKRQTRLSDWTELK